MTFIIFHDSLHFIQFEDDTGVIMSGNNPQMLYDCFNNELKELQNRLFVNNLALNAHLKSSLEWEMIIS